MLSLFPRDVLDEICDLIESVSEGFPTYSYVMVLIFVCLAAEFPKLFCSLTPRVSDLV